MVALPVTLVSVLNFSGNVYLDQRLAFSIYRLSSYFQIVSFHLSSLGELKNNNKLKRRVDEIEFESNLVLLDVALCFEGRAIF